MVDFVVPAGVTWVTSIVDTPAGRTEARLRVKPGETVSIQPRPDGTIELGNGTCSATTFAKGRC